MLTKIRINRFKNLEEVTLELNKLNVLIGSNNSGKSSILQAVQFSVSAAQTSAIYGKSWQKGVFSTSVLQEQLIYAPLRDTYSLAYKQQLSEKKDNAIKVEFEREIEGNNSTSTILVRKGRNKNLFINIENRDLGEELQNIDNPFSIYVPGLAGISHSEEYKTPAIVRKAAARGDSNKVFRNVLYLLKSSENWDMFESDFKTLFPDSEIEIKFNPERDDFIEVLFTHNNHKLPIDLAGTGVLQIVQILSYVNFYNPQILLLDEPDSHLHPNNQRKLSQILIELVEKRNLQIILTTHSRHLLDTLYQYGKVFWMKGGQIIDNQNEDFETIKILLDIGALDKDELLLTTNKIKCVLLTEDEKTEPIEILLKASGFKIDEVDVWSYKGCTNYETALTLASFIKKHSPNTEILVHRDRDYLTDEEINEFKNKIEKANINCFVTNGTDAESHFISVEHIISIYPNLDKSKIEKIIEESTTNMEEKSKEKFVNSRVPIDQSKSYSDGKGIINHYEISEKYKNMYDKDTIRYRHGKLVLNFLKSKIQQLTKKNVNLICVSEAIKNEYLESLAAKIWAED
jgi:predicted ATPase